MPELPEVETIARNLREGHPREDPTPPEASPYRVREPRQAYRSPPPEAASILGKTVTAVEVRWARTVAAPSSEAFAARLTGQTIQAIGRRAKYLVFTLDPDTLLIHLRMSGDIHVRPVEAPPAPHDRLLLTLDHGLRLAFHDTRKFGRAWLLADPAPVLGSLGPEPFDPALTPAGFHQALRSRRRQLKPLLLDQSFLAGLGNIYTDEALHRAGLHPLTQASDLDEAQAALLLACIRAVLAAGIHSNGASIDWVYRGGGFQNHFQVYRRAGEPCTGCGTPVKRILVGQRATHFCPVCQAEEGR